GDPLRSGRKTAMEGFVPGDKENEVNPSTRNFFQIPIINKFQERCRTILYVCTFVEVNFIRDVSTTNLFVLTVLQTPSILTLLHKFLDKITCRHGPDLEIFSSLSVIFILPWSFPSVQVRSPGGERKFMDVCKW